MQFTSHFCYYLERTLVEADIAVTWEQFLPHICFKKKQLLFLVFMKIAGLSSLTFSYNTQEFYIGSWNRYHVYILEQLCSSLLISGFNKLNFQSWRMLKLEESCMCLKCKWRIVGTQKWLNSECVVIKAGTNYLNKLSILSALPFVVSQANH